MSDPTLFVQLCALNERDSIGSVIQRIPRQISGIASLTILVVDDGSNDDTAQVASEAGADIIIRHASNQGLGRAFQRALHECLARGADLVVHLDADGQHPPETIPALVAPVLAGVADVVVGDRQLAHAQGMTILKRTIELIGSAIARTLTGTPVRDAVCGFRVYTRTAATALHLNEAFSYTLESLVQMGRLQLRIANVPFASRAAPRQSRLCGSMLRFVLKQTLILLRCKANAVALSPQRPTNRAARCFGASNLGDAA